MRRVKTRKSFCCGHSSARNHLQWSKAGVCMCVLMLYKGV
jgi:hypothetical protein